MPNCFSLTRKGDNSPSKLWDIDRAICQNLGFEYSETKWADNWYNFIGLGLALGHTLPQIIDICWEGKHYRQLAIAAYLNENYTSDAWYEGR